MGPIDDAVWEKLTISDAHYKARDEVEVVGDTHKSLMRNPQRTGNMKEEMKSNTQALIRTVCRVPWGISTSILVGGKNTSLAQQRMPSSTSPRTPATHMG